MHLIGLFGGTFDPIHYGHLRIALDIQQALGLTEVRMIPCYLPAHREGPSARAQQRLAMLHLAVANEPSLVVDEREFIRGGASYTVDTLVSLRADYPSDALYLILGSDAFEGLDQWHQWQRILSLAHIVVAHRPGWRGAAQSAMMTRLKEHYAEDVRDLLSVPYGKVITSPVTQLAISATRIRQMVKLGQCPRFLLPDSVFEYIKMNEIYQR